MNALRAIPVAAAIVLTGCASGPTKNPVDPLEPLNRGIYRFNEGMDRAVVKPVAKGYNAVVPPPVKMMVGNFFSNLDDVIVTANDVLQLKLKQGLADGARFVVNSTVGIYGLVDVGSMIGLEKHNEDFGQTLGKWGVGNGPYLVLPLLGPSTLRDSIGLYVDSRPSKLRRVTDMRARNELYALKAVSRRSQILESEKVLEEMVIDPYEFIRDAYLMRRRSLVYDGNPPREEYDEDIEENYDKAPIHNIPSSQQDVAPVIPLADKPAPSVGEVTTPADNVFQPTAVAVPTANAAQTAEISQPVADQPGIHKVWASQSNSIN